MDNVRRILDGKGFLVRPGDDRKEVTLAASGQGLRLLAAVVADFLDTNPAIDNEEYADMEGLDPEHLKRDLVRQLRDQGVERLEWRTP